MSKIQINDPKFVSFIKCLKKNNDLKIIDSHVHPFDVLSMVPSVENTENNNKKANSKKDKELSSKNTATKGGKKKNSPKEKSVEAKSSKKQKLKYVKEKNIEKIRFEEKIPLYSKIISEIYPAKFINDLKSCYDNLMEKRLLKEMDRDFIDYVACLPVAPWITAKEIKKHFNNKRFLLLGSLDVHEVPVKKIESRIKTGKKKFGIIGLKLHPNLQNFKPNPKDNEDEVGERLEKIYKMANRHKIYLHFHGGRQKYNWLTKIRYGEYKRSTTNGRLKNFFNKRGKSEFFDKIKQPIIIAHLGHFGVKHIDTKLVRKIVDNHDNIYFDTSAVSPDKIAKMLEVVGSDKLILGSDAIYTRMLSGIYALYEAVHMAKTEENRDDIMVNILGRNYVEDIYDPAG